MLEPRTKVLLWSWVPVLLWLGVIAGESTSALSSSNTGNWLYAILTAVFGHIDSGSFELFHAALRKSGHFIGYAVLGFLLFRAFVHTFRSGQAVATRSARTTSEWRWAVVAVLGTFAVASIDELHQAFLPSRTGAFHDVVLDTCGAVTVLVVIRMFRRRRTANEHTSSSI